MLNEQTEQKATSTVESKPRPRTRDGGRASSEATASVPSRSPVSKVRRAAATMDSVAPAPPKAAKKRRKRGSRAGGQRANGARKRGRKPYPVVAFADVLPLAEGIMKHNAGQPVLRETLLKKMGYEANAQSTRNLITNSNKYGATEGSYAAPTLKLTPNGLLAVSPKANPIEQRKALFALAIADVAEFNAVFEKRKGNNMPAPEMLHDDLASLDAGDRKACADVFTSNVKHLGMLVERDGAQYLMTLEEWLGQKPITRATASTPAPSHSVDGAPANADAAGVDFDKLCFVISTIKEDGSEQRRHADMIFSQYVDRALSGSGLKAVRSDKIGDPGMISKQVIEYILKSKLVVADLSFHNPNVFYELALRHVTGKPTVHLTRTQDRPPFDVGNFRAIVIDTTSVETAVMQLDTLRAEIGTAIAKTLANGESRDNPILTYCPGAKFVADGL